MRLSVDSATWEIPLLAALSLCSLLRLLALQECTNDPDEHTEERW